MPIPRFTVGELTRSLQEVVGEVFPMVAVSGEISEINFHTSGHWYLKLTDGQAVLAASFFRGQNQRMKWRPRPGDKVVATGNLDIYAPRGTYSLVIRDMERAGDGDLAARLEALRKRLTAEGLFDPGRKRPLPPLPRRVGVVTSPTGAALQDILKVSRSRFPNLPLVISPCRVQGAGSAGEVVAALARLAGRDGVDVILVARGGGSTEDLGTFNDEAVVRAIAACPVPVVSAVGHEVDVTLADLAADVRAATPSHAAELAIPSRALLQERLTTSHQALVRAMRGQVSDRRARLARIRLKDPRRRVQEARTRCDELESRLQEAAARALERHRSRLERVVARLDAVSPLAVMARGYAIALKDGRTVTDASVLSPGDALTLRFSKGQARARVEP